MLFTQFLVELGDTVTKAPFSKQTYHTSITGIPADTKCNVYTTDMLLFVQKCKLSVGAGDKATITPLV